jgi:hypothetical protein
VLEIEMCDSFMFTSAVILFTLAQYMLDITSVFFTFITEAVTKLYGHILTPTRKFTRLAPIIQYLLQTAREV